GSGREWTFGQLAAAAEKTDPPASSIVFAQGHSPEFIFQLLSAWRAGKPVCPLEPGQSPPQISNAPPNCAHLKTTSATTGTPRLVAFTAGQLAADAENIVRTMGLRPEWPNLAVISLAHSYGFSNLVLPMLLHGVPLILAPAPLPETVRHAAATAASITLPAVPAMWRAWHEAKAIPNNVGLAISAGAPLPLKLEQDVFAGSNLKIHNFYGASECGGIAYDNSSEPRQDSSLAGSAMQNVQLSIDDNTCLNVQSRAVGETYWPDASEALCDGVYTSSDLAELRDGKVFLRGRIGDLINVAGRKISPETIERALMENPRVRDCLVLGAPTADMERLETIVAVVVADAAEADLREFLLEKLPAWQVPRRWHFVDSLSANARGKISRAEWRRRIYDL
ncbi:MAG TPA: class I adenylate-forming enzyme family protein, partial [Desulfuromonadaceae bacterium]|nr:class I adenylate-forming enzyme family protein [Desulfuromonadaceae bacterium]